MFFRTAAVPFRLLGGFDDLRRYAQVQEKQGLSSVAGNIIRAEVFERVASVYKISPDPRDYGFLSALAVRANVPNMNGDAVSEEELFRFRPRRNCRTFETFINAPLQVNHFSSVPSLARGFIIDAYYNKTEPPYNFVEVVIAVDKKKDPYLAQMILSQQINKFSMGSLVESIKCSLSICGKVAYKEAEFCEHLRHQRMQYVNGELVFGWNIGVEYEELSIVENPAEKMALTRKIFANIPSRLASFVNDLPAQGRVAVMRRVAESRNKRWGEVLGLSEDDFEVIRAFLRVYKLRIPPSVVKALESLMRNLDDGE
jgi:hypothetical protein